MNMKFDLLEKFRRALFSADGIDDVARDASKADYLVKMNIPPLLGRRDAACEFLRELLKHELKELPLEERLNCYKRMLEILEYAIIDTESVHNEIAWGKVNRPISREKFNSIKEKAKLAERTR